LKINEQETRLTPQQDDDDDDDPRKIGGTNFIFRIIEQETLVTLKEYFVDFDDVPRRRWWDQLHLEYK